MNLPTGPVTFLFSDIEGSTRLWEVNPVAMGVALARHDALMRAAIVGANGHVFKTVGDAFCAAFQNTPDALDAAIEAQTALISEPWPDATEIRVRIALHTGEAETRDGDYFGPVVNRVARLLAIAHGGQTILSEAACESASDSLPKDSILCNLGRHALKDLALPELVFQLLHPNLQSEYPPLRSLNNPSLKHNLPHQATTFVGRESDLAALRQLMDTARLLTLTGAGGCGKSRLALQLAEERVDLYEAGVWFVELASLPTADLVLTTVANVLGVKEEPNRALLDTLARYLGDKKLLLLLDTCEHVLDECAQLAETIVRRCVNVRLLATSREAIGIAGERLHRVSPLSAPKSSENPIPENVGRFEAVQLFVERAAIQQPGFAVTDANAPFLASICRRLDGIPLAIELAAARIRSLSIEEIDRKLDESFRIVSGGSRTAMPRQQTLRAMIDWSYELLNLRERQLFGRLSVFVGGWTLAAAEEIGSGDDLEVLDLLTSLVDKSLVVADLSGRIARYRMLETVRSYACDRLSELGGIDASRDQALGISLSVAENAERRLTGPEQREVQQYLLQEHDNLRAALEWSLSRADPFLRGAGLRIAAGIWRFWHIQGFWREGLGWITRLVETSSQDDLTDSRAKALSAAGVLAWRLGDNPSAIRFQKEGLEISRNLGYKAGVVAALKNLGNIEFRKTNLLEARLFFEESLDIARAIDDRPGVSDALNNLGNVALEMDELTAARELYEESLSLRRELGEPLAIAMALGNLGNVAYMEGNYQRARELYEGGLVAQREAGDRMSIATSLNNLGNVAYQLQDYLSARKALIESMGIRYELGHPLGVSESLDSLAELASNPVLAARIWGAAEQIREDLGTQVPLLEKERFEQSVATARAKLGDDVAFDLAWREGRQLTIRQAIDLAVGDSTNPAGPV